MAAIDEKEYTQSFDWKIWKRLGPFLRPYRGAFVSMLVFNGICALVDVVLPLFQKYAIQNFIEKNTLTGLLPYALAYLAVILVQALSVVIFARNSMHIEMNLGKDMRGALFHHLQTLSFSFYNVTPVGYLLTRVMSDTNRISSMLAWNFTDILWAVFYVLGTFAAMLALNWRLALAVIAIVPVMAILTGYFQNRILHWNRKVRKLNSRITGAFNEGITGARTTKTLVTEEQTADAFRSLTRQMHDSGIRAARLNAVFIPLVLFFGTMAVSIVLLRGGYMVLDQALELVGLKGMEDRYPDELSGGEQQRVAIARALVNNPSTIVADEPTGNLDPNRSLEIMTLLERINALGTTVVVVTHERDLVNHFDKRVIMIDHGQVNGDGVGTYEV